MSLSKNEATNIYENMWYTLGELEDMPIITEGHTDDLKVEEMIYGVKVRVWLSRMTVADGMPYDNQVTVEYLDADEWCWRTFDKYCPPTQDNEPNV